jgi:hypothetical protein
MDCAEGQAFAMIRKLSGPAIPEFCCVIVIISAVFRVLTEHARGLFQNCSDSAGDFAKIGETWVTL